MAQDIADVVIIGAGIVGCAIAREVALDYDVLVLEKGKKGEGASTRNSGTIHAGMYYPPGSNKARLCVLGSKMMRDDCVRFLDPDEYEKTGKLIVAFEKEQIADLFRLYQNCIDNKVDGFELLTAEQMHEMEPNVKGFGALYSPNTWVVDQAAILNLYASQATVRGAQILEGYGVEGITRTSDGLYVVKTDNGDITTRVLINSAGLGSAKVAQMVDPKRFAGYGIIPERGEYADVSLSQRDLAKALVYPPVHDEKRWLAHTCVFPGENGGEFKIGPVMNHSISPDNLYGGNHVPIKVFREAAADMLEGIDVSKIKLGAYAGIRPKSLIDGKPLCDFYIKEELDLPGYVMLFNIESPGFTSASAIGVQVKNIVDKIKK